MRLADKVVDTLVGAVDAVLTAMPDSLENIIRHPFETILDGMESVVITPVTPLLQRLENSQTMPLGVRELARDARQSQHPWWAAILVPLALLSFIPGINAFLEPPSRLLMYEEDRALQTARWDPHDAAFIEQRDKAKQGTVESDLRDLGWSDERIQGFRLLAQELVKSDQIRQLKLRGLPEYEAVKGDLEKAGYTPERIQAIEALYWQLPSTQDLITMAVREVFTPDIAAKYGLFEDFPSDFRTYAEQQGISSEWAVRYWGAHWRLPSAEQGYEMLHRGIISPDELRQLLRALDVMPWWREKLERISYATYTRVDVRRMYKTGNLDFEGVVKAYRDAGYNEDMARNLADWTVAYYPLDEETSEDQERDYTKSEILDAYKKRMMDADEAGGLLEAEGYTKEQVDFYLSRENYKAEVVLQDEYLNRYRTLFVEGLIDADTAINDLQDIGIPSSQTQEELKLWYLDRITRIARPSRSDLARFLKGGIIDEQRWNYEMSLFGYSSEYIGWYRDELRD